MKLSELMELMNRHDRVAAPGSESAQWQAFCDDCYREYGMMPFDDAAQLTEVDEDFGVYWEAVSEGDYAVAEIYGEVPEEWRL